LTAALINFKSVLLAKTNRGLLLDIVVFLANVFLMHLLTRLFIGLGRQAVAGDKIAKFALAFCALGMWTLPVAGTLLKRWHFHQRLQAEGKTAASSDTNLAGCIFNRISYFCLNLGILAVILTAFGKLLFGSNPITTPGILIPTFFFSIWLTQFQTALIYRYFSPPEFPPTSEFLRSPQSETLGDICLFLNMILFQLVWNTLAFLSLRPPSSVAEFVVRLLFLCLIALLIYFPPRMIYLAEDINRPRTWLTMLLANSPVIVRLLLGVGYNGMTN
jgi:hypothetical protein